MQSGMFSSPISDLNLAIKLNVVGVVDLPTFSHSNT